MEEKSPPFYRILGIVIVITLLLIVGLFGAAIIYRNLIYKEEKAKAYLIVEEVYFVLMESNDGKYHLNVTAFITNGGEEDCYSKFRGFGIDKNTNLAMDDIEVGIGLIPAGKTGEYKAEMVFDFNGTFRIELLVFKDGLITVKGLGYVNLATLGTGGKDFSTTEPDPEMVSEDKSALAPFPGASLIIVGALSVAVLYAMIRRRRWSP